MKELDLLRQELLSCDTQLVDILMKRFDVVEKIMALKEKNQMQILQPEQFSYELQHSQSSSEFFFPKTGPAFAGPDKRFICYASSMALPIS